ncbi:hypothetical protein ACFLTD_03660, partial [Elusimicrobiota bacterium]
MRNNSIPGKSIEPRVDGVDSYCFKSLSINLWAESNSVFVRIFLYCRNPITRSSSILPRSLN